MVKLRKLLIEAKIQDDINSLIEELKTFGIIKYGKRTSTGSGAKGKFKANISTGGKDYFKLKNDIERKYKKTGETKMSGSVYYSPKYKLYFYFYPEKDRSYSFELDDYVEYDYAFLMRRKNIK